MLLVKPDDSIEVEVVRRLVQHQQGGLHEQSSVERWKDQHVFSIKNV